MRDSLKVGEKDILVRNNFLDSLFLYYSDGSDFFGYTISISKCEFERIFLVIYDVLSDHIGVDLAKVILQMFVSLLVSDARDVEIVDSNWIINHIWYLNTFVLDENSLSQYNSAVAVVRQRLVDIEVNEPQKTFFKKYRSAI